MALLFSGAISIRGLVDSLSADSGLRLAPASRACLFNFRICGVNNADSTDREFVYFHAVEFCSFHSQTADCKSRYRNRSYCHGAGGDSDAACKQRCSCVSARGRRV